MRSSSFCLARPFCKRLKDLIFTRNVPAVGTKASVMTRALKTNLVIRVIPSLMSRGNLFLLHLTVSGKNAKQVP